MNLSQKNIWIINEYAGSPYHGMEFRHYYLAKALIKLGYHVTIISASYSHLFKNLPNIKSKYTLETIDGIDYLWIKVPPYPSSHSKKRVIKWLVFTLSLFYLPIKQLIKPDYIILSPMQTMPIWPALRWAKKFNSKLIFEIKDIWPLSIIELGNYSPSHPFIKLLKYAEKTAIEKSDAITSVLPNYQQYLIEQGYNKKFEYIPNGIDLSELENPEPLDISIAQQIPEHKFIIMYTGTLGIANALNHLIDAAKLLSDKKNVLFVIVGNGDEKEKLITQSSGLNNILFLPAVPKKQIQSLLSKADACYIGLQNKNLFRYGVSPNKIFDYMYAGKPIIFSINSPNNVVEQAQCGLSVNHPDNPTEIAKTIETLYHLPKDTRTELGKNGKNQVVKLYNFDALAEKYHQLFQHL